MDNSTIIALAAVLLSILSPFLSSLINGIFRLKELRINAEFEQKRRNQEFYLQHRAEVIERYISAAGQSLQYKEQSISDFGVAAGEIYLYVDQELWPLLDNFALGINRKYDACFKDYAELCKALSKTQVRMENYDVPDKRHKHKPAGVVR